MEKQTFLNKLIKTMKDSDRPDITVYDRTGKHLKMIKDIVIADGYINIDIE